MKTRFTRVSLLAAATSLLLTAVIDAQQPTVGLPAADTKPLVQMAILLDTSGSMSGLIDQARTELWAIVNEFIFAKQDGKTPELQVALYEYGKSSLAKEGGFIRQILPFTTDLDKVSEELFALKTDGGDEYCGWVIKDATEQLKWSDRPGDLKVIFIAGNEPFTQGTIDYRQACKLAIAKGIVVNTIHCGTDSEGINGKWKDGAVLADGRYMIIDHNRAIVHIAAPQDKEIAALGAKLNETYIAYGRRASEARERQAEQDRLAASSAPAVAVQRSVAKSSFNYRNESWDLVDAIRGNSLLLETVKADELPAEMQKMNADEKKAYVDAKAKQRAEIQQKIQQLNQQRQKYVEQEMKKAANQPATLGARISKTIREQARNKNFTFADPNKAPESK